MDHDAGRRPGFGKPRFRTDCIFGVLTPVFASDMETPMNWELTDHTADFGLRVFGPDAKALFRDAALAIFDLMTDRAALTPVEMTPVETVSVQVVGDDWPDLMFNWLREVLYCWTGRELLVQDAILLELAPCRLSARLTCAPFDPDRHEILHEIKAVTYHDLSVEQTPDGWQARIILDV